jgi:hypothetical protein
MSARTCGRRSFIALGWHHLETILMPQGAENQDRTSRRVADQFKETRGGHFVAVDVICEHVQVQFVEPQDRAWRDPGQLFH